MRAHRYIAVMLLLIATTVFAHRGPETITINAAAKKQGPVKFAHGKHHSKLVKSCDTCHHTQKGLTEATATGTNVVKCTTCHLDPKSAKMPSMREASMTKNPFHIRCISCHRSAKKGPVVCTGCHVKA
jgi:hypothetical protein